MIEVTVLIVSANKPKAVKRKQIELIVPHFHSNVKPEEKVRVLKN